MDGVNIVLIGDELHITLSKDEVKKIISEKYGASEDSIEVSGAKITLKLQKDKD